MKVKLTIYTVLLFVLIVPLMTVLLSFVRTPVMNSTFSSIASLIAYWIVFPGWYLALWVFGYYSGPSTASTAFIVGMNSLLYASIGSVVMLILMSVRRPAHS